MIDLKELGLNLQMQRKLIGLTQEQLAEKANIATETLQKIETGKTNLTFNVFNKIISALDIKVKFKLEREE